MFFIWKKRKEKDLLLGYYLNPVTAGLARIKDKKRKVRGVKKRKEIEAQKVKRLTPNFGN